MSNNHSKKWLFNSVGESSESEGSGIYDERILIPVFASLNWDIRTLCQMSRVNRKLRVVAKKILWREMCVYRAAQMITALTDGSPSGRIGWQAMAKLMFFCNGCRSSQHFQMGEPAPGHFVKTSRFSKTSGRSFLVKKCRNDLLYVSDPCEHPTGDKDDDLGIFRGVFLGFMRSRTRACLIRRQVELEERIKCLFCGARVWSMTAARLVPKSAARRLGSMESGLEYSLCVNGHLHGACWLVPLSSDEGEEKIGDEDEDEGEDSSEEAFDGEYFFRGNQIVRNGQMGLSMV
ncbi:PREDICTED: LOW QUALITY PROTEIN: EID1-like F-box protein 3 [Nicotiana attenuata]|uniref:LOW QUALITY PROTEIN: EID1-like F-box protein 3 n=1 Tax=Nicotiana attenuata TaxID=49451 RepID=UPI000905A6F7|nr:PREDICTED: LOW QUALITY PROTEIN: EID1-like F-box protein 3 [Nicotiana attenuata]